jgi:hypothetical protein
MAEGARRVKPSEAFKAVVPATSAQIATIR